jgi:peptidoglycan/LPS O-acetylase OafA/YrhL
VRKVVIARLDACTYGALAAVFMQRLPRAAMALLSVVVIAIATWLFFGLPRDASVAAKLWSFTAAGVAMAAACVALSAPWRANRPLARLARWVYPLYLVNMPLLHAFALIGFGQSLSASSSVLRFAAWMLASVALAALVHYLLERPMLEWGRRVVKPAVSGASSR